MKVKHIFLPSMLLSARGFVRKTFTWNADNLHIKRSRHGHDLKLVNALLVWTKCSYVLFIHANLRQSCILCLMFHRTRRNPMSKTINLNCALHRPCSRDRFTQSNLSSSASELTKHFVSSLLYFPIKLFEMLLYLHTFCKMCHTWKDVTIRKYL